MPSTIHVIKISFVVVFLVAAGVVILDYEHVQHTWGSVGVSMASKRDFTENTTTTTTAAAANNNNNKAESTSSIAATSKQTTDNNKPKRNEVKDSEISISLIVIASGQRSSSTFLSEKVLASLPCHLTLNEILNSGPGQAFGDAWEKEGKELKAAFESRSAEPVDLASFILNVGQRMCQEMLDEGGPELKQQCHNHCWVNYKHFSVHMSDGTSDSLMKHTLIWNSLMARLDSNPKSSFSILVLERPVEERWRSTWFATQTGDWDTNGKAQHKEKLAKAEVPAVPVEFQTAHDHWFQIVRAYIKSFNDNHQGIRIPVLDLTFSDITKKPANATQALFQTHIASVHPINSATKLIDNNPSGDDTSISLIVIASGQRSSSTFFSEKVLAKMPCHLTLNEVLNTGPGQAFGDAWDREGKALRSAFVNRTLEAADLASFVLQVGQRMCKEMLLEGGVELSQQCGNHCWVNYKHFSVHMAGGTQDTDTKHTLLWNSLMAQLDSKQKSTFSMAILERDVADRWQSLLFAKSTGDWDIYGNLKHKERLAAAEIPAVPAEFRMEHDHWFQMVRAYAKSFNSHHQLFPVLELSFADATARPVNKTQARVAERIVDFASNP